MIQVLFFIAFWFFVFLAPAKVTLLVLFAVGVVTGLVQMTANAITGAKFTVGEAFKAIAWSTFFSAIGLVLITSFMHSARAAYPSQFFTVGLLTATLPYVGYVFGFRIGLGVTFIQAAAIALVSTALSVGFFLGYLQLISKVTT